MLAIVTNPLQAVGTDFIGIQLFAGAHHAVLQLSVHRTLQHSLSLTASDLNPVATRVETCSSPPTLLCLRMTPDTGVVLCCHVAYL